MFDSYSTILVSATFWVCYYFLMRHLLKDRSPEFCNRIITLVHGASVAILGVNQCFTGEVSPIYRPQNQSTTLQKFIIVWSLGYFLFDLGWCSYYQSETVLMITHHICSVVALWRMLMKDTSGGQASCCMGALEITNPLLQLRWFVRTFGYHKTPLFNTVEIVYLILFLFIRIVLGTFYIIIVIYYGNSWDYILLTTALYIISWMFVFKIFDYMRMKYSPILDRWRNASLQDEIVSGIIPSHS